MSRAPQYTAANRLRLRQEPSVRSSTKPAASDPTIAPSVSAATRRPMFSPGLRCDCCERRNS